MSYPDPRYHGAGGEATARFRPADAPPELPRPNGAASYLATGATTDGRFGLYRWDMGPRAGGAQPHFHRTIAESFFVLDGTVEVYDGSAWRPAGAGDFLYVPEGGLHGFRNTAPEPASMLILFTPGAPREAYFEGLVEIAEGRWHPTPEELETFFEQHDNIYV